MKQLQHTLQIKEEGDNLTHQIVMGNHKHMSYMWFHFPFCWKEWSFCCPESFENLQGAYQTNIKDAQKCEVGL